MVSTAGSGRASPGDAPSGIAADVAAVSDSHYLLCPRTPRAPDFLPAAERQSLRRPVARYKAEVPSAAANSITADSDAVRSPASGEMRLPRIRGVSSGRKSLGPTPGCVSFGYAGSML
jgi:hypothetical protein